MNLFTSNSSNNGKIRQSALFLFLFVLQLTLLEQLLLMGLKECNEGQVGKVNKIMRHELAVDLPIFGSSVANFHFDPCIVEEVTSFSSFNFGLTGTPLLYYKGLVEEYINYARPKAIILASTIYEFETSSQIYEVYKFMPYLKSDTKFYNSLNSTRNPELWRLKFIPFYSYSQYDTNFYINVFKGLFQVDRQSEQIGQKGFTPIESEWDEEDYYGFSNTVIGIDSVSVAAYRELIHKINTKGIKVIVVITPMYIENQKQLQNLDDVRKTFRDITGQQNILLDFTESKICTLQDNFYDRIHLSKQGAEQFSLEFSSEILDRNLRLVSNF